MLATAGRLLAVTGTTITDPDCVGVSEPSADSISISVAVTDPVSIRGRARRVRTWLGDVCLSDVGMGSRHRTVRKRDMPRSDAHVRCRAQLGGRPSATDHVLRDQLA